MITWQSTTDKNGYGRYTAAVGRFSALVFMAMGMWQCSVAVDGEAIDWHVAMIQKDGIAWCEDGLSQLAGQ